MRFSAIFSLILLMLAGWTYSFNAFANFNSPEDHAHDHAHDHDHDHDHDHEKEKSISYQPQTAEFKAATEKFRERLIELRSSEIRFHNAENVADEEKYRNEYYSIRESLNPLHREMLNTGLAEFLSAPTEKMELAELLYRSLERHFKRDDLDGLVPLARALYEAKVPHAEITQIYLVSTLANYEFEQARQLVQELIAQQGTTEVLTTVQKNIEELELFWHEEQQARQRDAQGEPLPQAKIVTSKGDIVVELFENDAPEAVSSFIYLAEQGFYDYLDFFLVVDQFGAQAGCPNEDGTGGPGYMLPDEFNQPNARKLLRGSLVLASIEGRSDSGGSQFFIPFMPLIGLPQDKTVFGRVISGMENVSTLNRIDPAKKSEKPKEGDPPKLPADEIIRVEILRKRNHNYEPKKLPVRELTEAPIINSNAGALNQVP